MAGPVADLCTKASPPGRAVVAAVSVLGLFPPQLGKGPVHEEPFALVVLTTSGPLISEVTTFLDPERLFPVFGLPMRLGLGA